MALAELDQNIAVELATKFKSILNFPWDCIEATAEDLIRWCTGAIVEDHVWPPDAQARWLAREARENWEKWLGTAALKQLFDAKFHPPKPSGNAAKPLGEKPPIECSLCNDFGTVFTGNRHRYCDCKAGMLMASDPTRGEKWLRLCDRTIPAVAARERREERCR
jgi:hypothetical protein